MSGVVKSGDHEIIAEDRQWGVEEFLFGVRFCR
jgi:hypothetical protein